MSGAVDYRQSDWGAMPGAFAAPADMGAHTGADILRAPVIAPAGRLSLTQPFPLSEKRRRGSGMVADARPIGGKQPARTAPY